MIKKYKSLLEYKKSTKDWHYNPNVPSVDYQYVGQIVDLEFDENDLPDKEPSKTSASYIWPEDIKNAVIIDGKVKWYEEKKTGKKGEESKKYGFDQFVKQFKSKSCYMFAVFDLNDRFLGTLGVDYNHSIYKLNKTEISYIKQKAASIGTEIDTYLYQNK